MRAIQIPASGQMTVVDVEKPALQYGQVLIRINYVGFCGSDLNTYRGMNPMVKMPVIPGHEIGATIEAVTDGVPENIKPGMVVTVNPYTNCGQCSACLSGHPNACKDNQTLGVQRNGAMQDYLAVPWQKIIPAATISPLQSALIEPMSVGFHAVNRAEVTDIDTVMVIGCGMIGMGAIVRAALRGATVIAVDVDDEKLELAKSIGAKHTINSKTEDIHSRLMDITDGFGPSVCIEAVGSPVTYRCAIDEIAFSGRVVFIGYAKTEIEFQTKLFVQKELTIRGSRNAMPEDFRAVINWMKENSKTAQPFITSVVKPQQAEQAMQKWMENPGKVFRIVVDFNN